MATDSKKPVPILKPIFYILVVLIVFVAGLAIVSNIADGAIPSTKTETTSSATTDSIDLEVSSTDDSQLKKNGVYIMIVRTRGASSVKLTINDSEVASQSVTNDDDWHDTVLRPKLEKSGKYQLILTASNAEDSAVSEKIINLTYEPTDDLGSNGDNARNIYVICICGIVATWFIIAMVRRIAKKKA